jgi:hypothetical protein
MRMQPIAAGRGPWSARLKICLAVAIASGAAAARGFEGTIDVRVTSQRDGRVAGVATQRIYLSPLGSRSEPVSDGGAPAKVAVLRLKENRDVVYRISETRKTYRPAIARPDAAIPRENFTAKRAGQAMLGGHRCEHVILTGDRGTLFEQWIAPAIKGLERFISEGQQALPPRRAALEVDGMPMKVILRSANGTVVTWEVTRIDRRPVPARLFEIARYEKESDEEED